MLKRHCVVAIFVSVLAAPVAAQQYPLMNMIADRVIQKYQKASCEDLWKQKRKEKTDEEKNLVQLLRDDPQMRAAFIDKIAAPVANKMFECGMFP